MMREIVSPPFAARFASPDIRDERALMGLTAGVLWIVAALTGLVGQLLPGSPPVDQALFSVLALVVLAYGVACVRGVLPWTSVSMRGHALVTGALMPVVGLAVWATGGAESYMQPLLLFPLLQIAYFFPLRMAAPLVLVLNLVFAAPLAYEDHPTANAFPSRVLCFVGACALLTVVLQMLKARLVRAEERQGAIARTDALTRLANRRGFDAALAAAIAAHGDAERGRRADDATPACALVLLDLDGFKAINDSRGHAAGDELLRAVAARCSEVLRPGDTLARIGGDEFAIVAPGAGMVGAARLRAAVGDALRQAGARATIAWAVHGVDAVDADGLLRVADRRLYEGKDQRGIDRLLPAGT
jgi:diguanylate cyclase (GGDEF)-like protein